MPLFAALFPAVTVARIHRVRKFICQKADIGFPDIQHARATLSARGRCAHCGRTDALATARLYPNSHGLLLRCPGCTEILLRLVDTGDTVCLDLQGLSFVELRRD